MAVAMGEDRTLRRETVLNRRHLPQRHPIEKQGIHHPTPKILGSEYA